ncbi:MAG: RHS repeat-associated core domain-containing protein [Planctomycetota bacterium]
MEPVGYDAYGRFQLYDAAGIELGAPDSSSAISPLLFTGHYFDPESGLFQARARYYNPFSGRFISHDPAGFATGLNAYLYAGDNPFRFTDSGGRVVQALIKAGIDAAWGAGFAFVGSLLNGESFGVAAVRGAIGGIVGALSGFMTGMGIPQWPVVDYITGFLSELLNGTFDAIRRAIECGFKIDINKILYKAVVAGFVDMLTGPMARFAAKVLWKLGLGKICPLLGKLACQVMQTGVAIGLDMATRNAVMSQLFSNCFVAGTLVLMADGTTKPIEEIEVGDEVLTRDENHPEGETTVGVVVKLFRNVSHDGLLTIEWSDPADTPEAARAVTTGSHSVTTTPGHEWYVVERGWILAKDIKNGDVLVTADGRYVAVRGAKCGSTSGVLLYNVQVSASHTYFVGSAQSSGFALAHNKSIIWRVLSAPFGFKSLTSIMGSAERAANLGFNQTMAVSPGPNKTIYITTNDALGANQMKGLQGYIKRLEARGYTVNYAAGGGGDDHAEAAMRRLIESHEGKSGLSRTSGQPQGRKIVTTNNICPACQRTQVDRIGPDVGGSKAGYLKSRQGNPQADHCSGSR